MNTRERTLTSYALHVLVYAHVHLEGTSRRGPVKTGGAHVPTRTGNVGVPASGQMGTHVVPNRYLEAKKPDTNHRGADTGHEKTTQARTPSLAHRP